MEYSKEDLMEAKKQILGVGENMGTEESKKYGCSYPDHACLKRTGI